MTSLRAEFNRMAVDECFARARAARGKQLYALMHGYTALTAGDHANARDWFEVAQLYDTAADGLVDAGHKINREVT